MIGGTTAAAALEQREPPRSRFQAPQLIAATAALLVCLIAASAILLSFPAPDYRLAVATEIGQRSSTRLQDQTRLELNTNSRVEVRFTSEERQIRLNQGEVLFDIAKDGRPFVVAAGDYRIRALGTRFVVRLDEHGTSVTLLEGRIAVMSSGDAPRTAAPSGSSLSLEPGQRLVVAPGAVPTIGTVSSDAALAWQREEIVLEDVSLAEAAAEFNRYSRDRRIEVHPDVAALEISGVFHTRDGAEFARAAAAIHGLKVEAENQSLVLAAN